MLQTVLVGCMVAGCTVYAVWTLMPQGLRQHLAQALLAAPQWTSRLPRRLRTGLQRAAQGQAGCAGACGACSGPDAALPQASPQAERPLVFHPPRRQP